MPINTEMFQRIKQIINLNPEQHSQAFFEITTSDVWRPASHCGTTRCVAGWAIHLWGEDNGITNTIIEKISTEYAKRHDMQYLIDEDKDEEDHYGVIDVEVVASHILGLSASEGRSLFFDMDDSSALARVEDYASGQSV